MLTIGNVTDHDVAKTVYAEGGVFVGKNYNALLAIAQCIYDQWYSGKFGKDLRKILDRNFNGKSDVVNEECLKAVHEVFARGVRRFPDAKIIEFRSFTKYSDGNGELDKTKCADLLEKYEYLGSDSIGYKWGHFYFGKKDNPYYIQFGSFKHKMYADQYKEQLRTIYNVKAKSFLSPISGQYVVYVGFFKTWNDANDARKEIVRGNSKLKCYIDKKQF